VGIITAENPQAQKLSPKENKQRNHQLKADVREMGYGFYQIQGKYGNIERPLVISNIDLVDLIRLGQKHDQETVIWVRRTNRGSQASLIGTSGNYPAVHSRVVLPLAKNTKDFYSLYKGRKLTIPFFDELLSDKQLIRGRVV